MYPIQLLVVLVLMTAAGLMVQIRGRRRRMGELRELGGRERMHYSRQDRFGLAARVARHFPVPGVADVRVSDLLYRSDDAGHRYVFTVDYTRGVLGAKRRVRDVVMMTEQKEAPGEAVVRVGDGKGLVSEQYRALLGK